MAAVENIKSTPITNYDANPPLIQDAGVGAQGVQFINDGSAAVTGTNSSAGSTYQLCRIPPNSIIKGVRAWLDATGTTITCDIGVTFSTAPTDGTPSADQPATFGGVPVYVNTTAAGSAGSAQSLFAHTLALAAIVEPTEEINQAGNMTGVNRQKRLWDVLGLSGPPAGSFDITATLTSTAGSAAVINVEVTYVVG